MALASVDTLTFHNIMHVYCFVQLDILASTHDICKLLYVLTTDD